ncbi:MAG: hypothetical protein IJ752_03220 [Alphaproteobacteria bacterium]|nr:hypothetical protein [Alphaproteobacteria bacterium]
MKKLLLILSVMVFSPVVSQAETAFDQDASFTVAKAFKLGRDISDDGSFLKKGRFGTEKPTRPPVCKSGQYLKGNTCVACPANATCGNGRTFSCENGYYSSDSACIGICSGVNCQSGFSPTVDGEKCCCVKDYCADFPDNDRFYVEADCGYLIGIKSKDNACRVILAKGFATLAQAAADDSLWCVHER